MEGLIFGILRVFPRKVSNTTTRKSMFAISVRNFLACSQTLYFLFKVERAWC